MKTTKDTVNSRVMLLKTKLKLTQNEFCFKAKISSGTLHNIRKGGIVSDKMQESICEGLNVNPKWLENGEGEIFLPAIETQNEQFNPWKDALVNQMKEENLTLRQQIDKLTNIVMNLSGKVNFINSLEKAYGKKLFPNAVQLNAVSGAKLRGAA